MLCGRGQCYVGGDSVVGGVDVVGGDGVGMAVIIYGCGASKDEATEKGSESESIVE